MAWYIGSGRIVPYHAIGDDSDNRDAGSWRAATRDETRLHANVADARTVSAGRGRRNEAEHDQADTRCASHVSDTSTERIGSPPTLYTQTGSRDTVSVRVSCLGLLSGWRRCSLFVTRF